MTDDKVILQCSKTGREYVAEIVDGNFSTVINARCPYCENRGKDARIDDIQKRIDDVKRRAGKEK